MAGSIRFEAYSVIRIRWFQFDSRSEIGVNFLIRELKPKYVKLDHKIENCNIILIAHVLELSIGVALDYRLLSM